MVEDEMAVLFILGLGKTSMCNVGAFDEMDHFLLYPSTVCYNCVYLFF